MRSLEDRMGHYIPLLSKEGLGVVAL